MTRQQQLREEAALRWVNSGKYSLLYVLRSSHGSIELGPDELDRVRRLAAWWGVKIELRALGHGSYLVARPRTAACAG